MDVLVSIVLSGMAANMIAAILTDDSEVGPFGAFVKWRNFGDILQRSPMDTLFGEVKANIGSAMTCPICLSFWVLLPIHLAFVFFPDVWSILVLPFAGWRVGLLVMQISDKITGKER